MRVGACKLLEGGEVDGGEGWASCLPAVQELLLHGIVEELLLDQVLRPLSHRRPVVISDGLARGKDGVTEVSDGLQ